QATALLPRFGSGPVVIGPEVPELAEAGRSARAALSALQATRAWPSPPRPVLADELLPERAPTGDNDARRPRLADVDHPLQRGGGPSLTTLSTYLRGGRSLEATARLRYVHPHTVRYRLRRIATVTGWVPVDAREGFVLQIAIAVGQLAGGVAL